MNRKLYVGIMSFFAVVFTISINFLPFYNPIYFYLQHVSLFLFMAMFIYYLLKLGYDRLQKRVKNTNLLKGYMITIFIVFLFLFSNIQLYAIETYQTSDFQSCSYYDENGNAIYYTQLRNQCPDIEIFKKTNEELSFRVYETISGKSEPGYMITSDVSYDLEAKLRTDIKILYFSDGSIQNVETKKSTNIRLYNHNEEYKVYNSFYTFVENSRIYDSEHNTINQIVSNMTVQIYHDQFYNYEDFNNVNHYEGDDFSEYYVGYQSSRQDYGEPNQRVFQIVTEKVEYQDDSFLNGKSEILRIYDGNCFEDYCSISEGTTDGTLQSINPREYYNDIYAYISYYNNEGITYDYETYHYQENEEAGRYVTYSDFHDYPLVIKDEYTSYESIFNPSIERRSFIYRGRIYLEHGTLYSIFNQTEYGTKIITKDSTMSSDNRNTSNYASDYVTSEYSSVDEITTINNYFNAIYINDYGSRLVTRFRAESYEVFYYKNPLVFSLLDYQ